MNKLLALGTLALVSGALAAPRISAQSIIVNPTPTDLAVRVYTDKDPTGQGTPNYAVGERIRLFATVNQDAYVYLFNVNPDGSIDQILPNNYSSGANFIRANEVRQFPGANDQYSFDVAGPFGLNKVLALASKTQLNLNQISSFTTQNTGFATVNVRGQENLAQALSIVVNPIPQNTWVTDVAFYNTVGQATPTPVRTGSLTVTTNIPNATVFLNDRSLGASGTTFTNLAPGSYRVRVSAPGYADYTANVAIRANATVNLNVTLQATRVNLVVRSNVNGATVFVNGASQGTIQNGQLALNLDRDDYQIVLIAPGYSAAVQNVAVRNGGTLNIPLTRLPQ